MWLEKWMRGRILGFWLGHLARGEPFTGLRCVNGCRCHRFHLGAGMPCRAPALLPICQLNLLKSLSSFIPHFCFPYSFPCLPFCSEIRWNERGHYLDAISLLQIIWKQLYGNYDTPIVLCSFKIQYSGPMSPYTQCLYYLPSFLPFFLAFFLLRVFRPLGGEKAL